MRKVITGEQVAQLYNRDPFALPGLAGTDLPDPCRVHPAGAAGPAAGLAGPADRPAPAGRRHRGSAGPGLGERRLAGPGLAGRLGRGGPGRVAVLLAGLVHPVGQLTCPGPVAGLVLPAPLGRGDGHLRGSALAPGAGHPAGSGQGVRHPVHRPGSRPAGLRAVPGRRRQARRRPGARVRRPAVPGPHRQVRASGAGVRPPRRPGRHHPRRPDPRPARISRPCRSAAGRTGCPGWSGYTARTC